MRPLIGITTYREKVRWGVWDEVADVLHANYGAAVEAAGGIPVLLPAVGDARALATDLIARIDGLIIAGGADVDPARYGVDAHARTSGWREERDVWELALLEAAATVALPVLGICRGMQVMAIQAGGILEQHTPDVVGHEGHGPGGDVFGDVAVEVVPGTVVAALLEGPILASCHHHQSVRTHPGLVPSAHADDGTLEAMEDPSKPFWVAVQWHPETGTDGRLFAALVAAAAAR